jgi:hypothetical protein
VTWNEVRARRLARSSLAKRASAQQLVEVLRDVGGVHAQIQSSAELQLAARIDGLTQEDMRSALWERRELVKAWTLRGTLHIHPADELPLWLAAARKASPDGRTTELEEWVDPRGVRHPALGPSEVEELRVAVLAALDGRALLREALATDVIARVGRKVGGRLRSGFAFFGGAELCQGPPQGAKITLARADQWIENWVEVDETDALREVTRRFIDTYGPASAAGFREWFSSREFDAGAVEDVDVEGQRAVVLEGDTEFPEPEGGVRLLPEYDVYVMGFREREQLVPASIREQVATHGRGRYEGPAGVRFLLVDGLAAGLWERKKRGKRIELTVTSAKKLSRAQRAELEHEAERIGAFLGLEPVLTVE